MKRIPFLMTLGAGLVAAGERKPKELPVPGESFLLEGREAFLILPENRGSGRTPWVWYAPTLPGLPGPEERWMFAHFLAAGIGVAGIDAGESYGSPDGCRIYDRLYAEMTGKRGMSAKPVMLGRSRGGLMTLSWAAGRPDCCGGFAGIYPVCDLTSYPGLAKACGAFGLSEAGLAGKLREHNPVERLSGLAKAGVPFFAVHGDVDTLVPLEKNSGALASRYRELGGTMELIVPKGQGHSMWEGFFRCAELVAFVKKHAKGVAP